MDKNYIKVISEDSRPVPYRRGKEWTFIRFRNFGLESSESYFDKVEDFENGIAIVTRNGVLGLINNKGKELTEVVYSSIIRFENLFIANGNVLLNNQGSILSQNYNFKSRGYYGLRGNNIHCIGDCFVVTKEEELTDKQKTFRREIRSPTLYYLMDFYGNIIIQNGFLDIGPFNEFDLSVVCASKEEDTYEMGGHSEYQLLHKSGILVPLIGRYYTFISSFNALGLAVVQRIVDHVYSGQYNRNMSSDPAGDQYYDTYRKVIKHGIINIKGEEILECTYTEISFFENDKVFADDNIIFLNACGVLKTENNLKKIEEDYQLKLQFANFKALENPLEELGKIKSSLEFLDPDEFYNESEYLFLNGFKLVHFSVFDEDDIHEQFSAQDYYYLFRGNYKVDKFDNFRTIGFSDSPCESDYFIAERGGKISIVRPQVSLEYDFKYDRYFEIPDKDLKLVKWIFVIQDNESLVLSFQNIELEELYHCTFPQKDNFKAKYHISSIDVKDDFSQSLIHFYIEGKEDSSGLFDLKGRVVLEPIYTFVSELNDNQYIIYKGDFEKSKSQGDALFDLELGFIIPFKNLSLSEVNYTSFENEEDEYYTSFKSLEARRLNDNLQSTIIEDKYILATSSSPYKQGLFNKEGKVILEIEFDKIEYRPGILKVEISEKFGVFDFGGNMILAPLFDEIKYHYNSFLVKKGSFFGLYEKNGNALLDIEDKYTKIELNHEAPVLISQSDKKYGVFSISSKTYLIKNVYDQITFKFGFIIVYQTEKYGVFNLEGNQITNIIYDRIEFLNLNFESYFIIALQDNKTFILDEKGKVINCHQDLGIKKFKSIRRYIDPIDRDVEPELLIETELGYFNVIDGEKYWNEK
ncbi:WG repeat-containing protein [Arcticibacterium luteifluviistationis]|uniref:WG repeat-containing protein n=1 Tax=Arcticibacterium luteifluviistationis TaxID=1784714 RepID=A0A2Z4GGX8_9BACT|nr:WG repeat-containing protein [Arcticibacterium luteifluviistationis]AWW00275.1 hypothetical protein DJ013_19700 [Arcticibacterium luteifluviistationis]